jgi:WD40 repeat protein
VLYDVQRLRPLTTLRSPAIEYRALEFAPDDKTLAAGSWDGTTRFLSLPNRQWALTIETGGILGLAFSPDGTVMATSGFDGTMRLWPAPSLAEIDAAEKRR